MLEILDARDPLGTRCKQVEQAVSDSRGNKRLVLLLNKAGLLELPNYYMIEKTNKINFTTFLNLISLSATRRNCFILITVKKIAPIFYY